jgi:hypothetical protein
MQMTTTVARFWIRGVGAIQIVLGVLLWFGLDRIQPLHILVGITIVLALWILAGVGAAAGVSSGLVAVAAIWGLITPILGLAQTNILTTSGHWVIQVLHLLVGIVAIALGENLARNIVPKLAASAK